MKVWVTRARPGADRTAERLIALGFEPILEPLLAIQPIDAALDLKGIEALAFTSRNGVAAYAAMNADRSLPVFVVGDATAQSARQAGFNCVRSAEGDLAALAALIRTEARGLSVLHPAALEPAGDLASLIGPAARVRSIAVYRAEETRTASPAAWDAVLIHSPRAGRALATRLADAGSLRSGRSAVAISPAAAAPLAFCDFKTVRIAAVPTEASLLSALSALGKPDPAV